MSSSITSLVLSSALSSALNKPAVALFALLRLYASSLLVSFLSLPPRTDCSVCTGPPGGPWVCCLTVCQILSICLARKLTLPYSGCLDLPVLPRLDSLGPAAKLVTAVLTLTTGCFLLLHLQIPLPHSLLHTLPLSSLPWLPPLRMLWWLSGPSSLSFTFFEKQ